MIGIMNPKAACGTCGTPLTAGFCPRCLLNAGVSPDPDELPAQAEPATTHSRLGDYELLEEIGRGGMAIVYRARQVSLDRTVAVKMLPFGGLADKQSALRLRAEAVAAGGLRHPNIVTIHEVGLHNEQQFIVMDYVPGPSLARLLREGPLPGRQATQLIRQVALAVQHAHERGIIHRDLKPSNILLDSMNDQPRITDFGLAKNLRSDTQLTLAGQTLGSPNYIPPEQIRGNEREEALSLKSEAENPIEQGIEVQSAAAGPKITFASDVYALGATLYHTLTGRPPFIGHDIAAVLHQVVQNEPLPLRRLNPSVAADLETICLKCLEKEPGHRYATAKEMADELGRFLNDEPIQARPLGRLERAWRWCRRNPIVASLSWASLLLLLVVAIGGPVAAIRINRERQQAELRAYTADMNIVQQAWDEGKLARAQALLRAYIPKPGQRDLRGFEWRYLWKLCQDESRLSFSNFPSGVRAVLAPDGRFAAAACGKVVKLLDYSNGSELSIFPVATLKDDIDALAFSPVDTNVLATASGQTLSLWNLSDRRLTATITFSNPAVALAISRDGKLLAAAGGHEQTVELWRLADCSLLWTRNTPSPVIAILFAPDGRSLISGGGGDSGTLLWDLDTGRFSPFSAERQGWINALSFSPDNQILATAITDSTVILWDFAQRRLLARLIAPSGGPVESVIFSPDGRSLVTGHADSTVRAWDIATRQQKAIYRGHHSGINGLALSRDGQSIISSSLDGTVKVWDLEMRPHEEILATGKGWVTATAFSPDGKRLASVGLEQGLLTLWDVNTRRRLGDLNQPSSIISPAGVFSPNGDVLAQLSGQQIKLWDVRTLSARGELTNDFDAFSLSFAPDGLTLGAAGLSTFILHGITNRLVFWDLSARKKINKLAAAAPLAMTVSFSHDGRMVAIGYLTGQVRVWDYATERLLAEFTNQHGRIWSVAFSPDDAWLVAGGDEGAVVFYDLQARRAFPPVTSSSGWILGVAFAADGRTLASAEGDGTVKLWNVATREIALTLRGHLGACTAVAFSPAGDLLASSGADSRVLLWPAASVDQTARKELERK